MTAADQEFATPLAGNFVIGHVPLMKFPSEIRGALLGAALALAAFVSTPAPASAQQIISTGQSFVSGRLLPGTRQEDGSRLAGLRLTMEPGWKTYWRSPGEAGIPPRFDWSASTNIDRVEVLWPRPRLFMSFGLRTVGYRDQVVFPLRVTPSDPSRPVHLALTADLGVCKEMCVFERFDLSETIAADMRPIGAAQIARATATIPRPAAEAGLRAATCRIMGTGRDRQLDLRLEFGDALDAPVVLIEGTEQIWVSKITSAQIEAGVVQVTARLKLASAATWIDRGALRMTVLAGDLAADVRGCAAPAG